MKIELGGVPETLLITVRARAIETKREKPALSDPYAVSILEALDMPQDEKCRVSSGSQLGCVVRSVNMDNIARDFMTRYPEGSIVALGCGLDARYERLGKSCAGWWDIDLPDAIAVRRRFFREKENYRMIACSMLDYAWMDAVPRDRPVLVMAEGVFMYFPEEQLKKLFSRIFAVFPVAEMAFDTIAPFLANRTKLHPDVRKYNAVFKWGLDRAEELRKWDPGIRVIKSYYHMDSCRERWPLAMRIIGLVPAFRRGNKVVHIGYARN